MPADGYAAVRSAPYAGADAVPGGARLLQRIYLPTDELCLSLCSAESCEGAERLAHADGLPVDRVLTALLAGEPGRP